VRKDTGYFKQRLKIAERRVAGVLTVEYSRGFHILGIDETERADG